MEEMSVERMSDTVHELGELRRGKGRLVLR